jgi:hypothetical protein
LGSSTASERIRRATVAAVYLARNQAARYPVVALPIERALHRGEVVDDRTDIVIEGAPSSANSFAVAAFRAAQEPRTTRIAHHTHAPAQIIRAERLCVPALVLIREPEEAVLSLVVRTRSLTPVVALRAWVGFYESLLPHRESFVVGTFHDVVSDFGAVTRRVNERFGRAFVEFRHTEANVARIMGEIEGHQRAVNPDGREHERLIPRPSEVRNQLKREMRPRYREAPHALKARAGSLFDRLSA